MAASNGTWSKGKFIPAKHTMAIVHNSSDSQTTEQEKSTLASAFDDVSNNLNTFDTKKLENLRHELNILLEAKNNNGKIKTKNPPPKASGKITTAFGPDPRNKYQVKYEIVEADSLIASNTATGAINPAFPAELQPRDRTRTASRRQVEQIAKNLNPDALLTEFRSLDRGTPIIGKSDNVVESGNGRALALNLARDQFPDQYANYKAELKNRADSFGLDPNQVEQLKTPVLVRRRVDDVNRTKFAQAANSASILGMSETEKAKTDSERITTADINRLDIGDNTDQDLRAVKNRSFIRSFVGQLPENERATIIDRNGDLTQSGLTRVKAALFTRVYDDTKLSDRIFESTDNDMKNVTNGLMASLGKIAKAEEMTQSGQRNQDLSIKEDVTKSVAVFSSLKQRGISTEEYLSQGQMFGRELTPIQEKILIAIDKRRRSGKKIKELFNTWGELVEGEPHPQQSGFFGGTARSKEDLVDIWLKEKPKQQTSFF